MPPTATPCPSSYSDVAVVAASTPLTRAGGEGPEPSPVAPRPGIWGLVTLIRTPLPPVDIAAVEIVAVAVAVGAGDAAADDAPPLPTRCRRPLL